MFDVDCCSKYKECSDAMKCLHADDPFYANCTYRKKLEQGIVFYGKNAGKKINKKSDSTSVYLHCYDRLFAIKSLYRGKYSYKLKPWQASKIRETFSRYDIPFKTKLTDEGCVVDKVNEEDPAPANSRIVFIIDGEDFVIYNFNIRMIKEPLADKIHKAFQRKGIESRLELRGRQYSNYAVINSRRVTHKSKTMKKTVLLRQNQSKEHKQMSLFDMTG